MNARTDRVSSPANLFVLGAPKCGTTYVHSLLGHFPDVYMSEIKEPGFYSSDRAYKRGQQYYRSTFFHGFRGQRWVGEATPWYLYSQLAAERIAADVRDPYFVVCLRDPANRAISMYQDQVRAGHEDRRPEHALSWEFRTSIRLEQDYLGGGEYRTHLERWANRFDAEKFLVLLDQDLERPSHMMSLLSNFLNCAAPSSLNGVRLERNSAGAARWPLLSRALSRADRIDDRWKRLLRQAVPDRWIRHAGEWLVSVNRSSEPPASVPPRIRESLCAGYRESVLELEMFLGRDLSYWPSHPGFRDRAS